MWWTIAAKAAQNAIGTVGTYYNTRAQNAALKYQARQSRLNARLERQQAETSLERGMKQEQQIQNAAAKLKGSQKVAYGAGGVRLDSRSAQNVMNETDYMAQVDELQTRANALADAWSHRLNAVNYENQADIALSKRQSPIKSAIAYSIGKFLQVGSFGDFGGGSGSGQPAAPSAPDAPAFTIYNRTPYVGGQGFSMSPYGFQGYGFNWWRQ